MLSFARNILPALMMVCLFSFIVRGLEVWSGVKSMTGSAYAVEASDEEPPKMMEAPSEDMAEQDDNAPIQISDEEESGAEEDDSLDAFSDFGSSPIQAELAADLVKQRKRLDEREQELSQKTALLKAAEQELDRKFQELVALRKDIEGLLEQQSEEEDNRIQSLVKIYEGMKAKQAANIFNTLDLDILIQVISQMSERKASPILAAMNPERARTITILLAEQKQLPKLPGQ